MKNQKYVRSNTSRSSSQKTATPPRRHWARALTLAGVVLVLALIGLWAWRSNRNHTSANLSVDAPAVTSFYDDNAVTLGNNGDVNDGLPVVNNDRTLGMPGQLRIRYDISRGDYVPALRMDATDAELNAGIKIRPFVKGKWRAHGANTLVFVPAESWPANQKFTVNISKNLINSDLRAPRRAVFSTPKLTATINSFAVYANPVRNQSMIGVGVVSFNYAVNRNIDDKITVKLDGTPIDFSVQFDSFARTAIITTGPIAVRNTPQNLRMTINDVPAAAGHATTDKITATATVESADNLFKVSSVDTSVADDENGAPRQLILVNMTAAANSNTKWSDYIDAWLLPRHNSDPQDTKSHHWTADEITNDVLGRAKKLNLTPVDLTNPAGVYQYAFEYDVSDKNPRYIYVRLRPGIMSQNGFALRNGIDKVMNVTYPTRGVKIAGSGALLALGGDRRLTIVGRGGASQAFVNVYKVKSSEINHLISQTYNIFSPLEFKSWAFGAYDMSVVFQKTLSFADASPKRVNYASINLDDYLDRTPGDKTGIFIIQTGATQNQADYNDRRLILLTNLGLIRKVNADESSSVFVSRLGAGGPARGVSVSVLGRNGNAVWTGETNSQGRADIPRLAWSEYKNAREPVAIVARNGNDVSFIPYNGAWSQQVEYSKFDVDGTYGATAAMNAFLFSDRGIYRPGEEIIIGAIVKEKNFKSLGGVPVKFELTDARGKTVLEKNFSLTADGMFDIRHQLAATAPTGEYSMRLYSLNDRRQNRDLLGDATLRVEEFVPDTLEITAGIDNENPDGWTTWNTRGHVTLRNLYGAPAADARITAHAVMTPTQFSFAKYRDYQFTPNFIDGAGMARSSAIGSRTISWDLPDITTDANGNAEFDIVPMTPPAPGTYSLTLTLRGMQGQSGKSVRTTTVTRVSDAKYLVGYRASGDLSYVSMGAARSLNLVALDAAGARTSVSDLRMRVIRRENLTSLLKDYNGYYKYQTVTRDRVIRDTDFLIAQAGSNVQLDTQTPGRYVLQIMDGNQRILVHAEYFVAGNRNAAMTTDTNADLKIKIDRATYAPGDQIEIDITAPYAGTGLITIERDRVYAAKWFQTDTTASSHRIRIPDNFQGSGYVNISFVRDINSRDVFTTPYAYAVAPFTVRNPAREIQVKLDTPDIVRDGRLTVTCGTNRPARLMLFAVDAGILQVAQYQIPRPLQHFFQKAALQVTTYQILSLLLPEYNALREFAKTGGGDFEAGVENGAGLTNPFARRVSRAVAFYSGIVQTDGKAPKKFTFDIPDSFNGALRVFAVAANDTAVGAADATVRVQSPVIITPTVPLAVAPGDSFNAGAMIANMTPNSGQNASVAAHARVSDNLELTTDGAATLTIPENRDALWTLNIKATDKLGAADVNISADVRDGSGKSLATGTTTATLSVRPVTPMTTDIQTGRITAAQTDIKKFRVDMYPEYAARTLYVSRGNTALMLPLFEYLKKYDYSCTEQLTSRAMPWVLLGQDALANIKRSDADKFVGDIIATLKNRQNDDGSFSLWAGGATSRDNESNANAAMLTAYVAEFLMTARDAQFQVPTSMLNRAVDFLRTYAGENTTQADDALARAYAIYVTTRAGFVTTGYIGAWTEYADKNIPGWESSLAGAYIATAYKIMKQDAAADDLMSKYKASDDKVYGFMRNKLADDAAYAYLGRRYFNMANVSVENDADDYIRSGAYDAFTAARLILALSDAASNGAAPQLTVMANGTSIQPNTAGTYHIPDNATEIAIECPTCDAANQMRYSLVQTGFPRQMRDINRGIEIRRDYYDAAGNRVTTIPVGQDVTVKIFARTTGSTDTLSNAVITDLLPGGFAVDTATLDGPIQYADIREDRVLIFTDITRRGVEFTYTATATTPGVFQIPTITAAGMYAPTIRGTGRAGTFKVTYAEAN